MERKSVYEPPRVQLFDLVAESVILTGSSDLEDPVASPDELDW